MKSLFVAAALLISTLAHASFTTPEASYIKKIESQAKIEVATFGAELESIGCGPYYDGISCSAVVTFEGQICGELYEARGSVDYLVVASNCPFRTEVETW